MTITISIISSSIVTARNNQPHYYGVGVVVCSGAFRVSRSVRVNSHGIYRAICVSAVCMCVRAVRMCVCDGVHSCVCVRERERES